MKISVIIPTYNCADYIKNAINSVLFQKYRGDIEVIVVDDGSTDNTKKVLEEYIKNKQIIYIKQKNKGQASARNTGFKKSTGELIAFLDSDDTWNQDKLTKQIEKFKYEKVGLVYTGVEWYHSIDNEIIKIKIPRIKGKVFKKLLLHNFLTTSTIILRREAFEDFNFAKKYSYVEDYDLWLRVSKKWKVDYVKEVLCKYRIHDNNHSRNLEVHYANAKPLIESYTKEVSKSFLKKSLWYLNFDTAYSYYKRRYYKESKMYLKRAIKNKWWYIKNYKLLLRNILKL